MSGRIRSIKPELLDDAVTAGLSDMSFRLFIAAIVLADDYGRLRAEPGWLMGQVYWARTMVAEEFLVALKALEPLVLFYEVNGQRYAEIRNWSKHQKVSHPGKPRVPAPPESLSKPSGESPETLVPDLRSPIPISDPDQGSRPPTAEPPPSTKLPEWFGEAIATVELETGVTLRPADSWLRYSGHRRNKGIAQTPQDAVYWLTTVMVPEARKELREAADKRDREAKFEAERAARDRARAGPTAEPQKISPEEQAELARMYPMRRRNRGAA